MTATQAPEIILDDDQKTAVEAIISSGRKPVIVTGRAGSGKSEVVRQAAKRGRLALTATTGRAALLIGGTTVDRQFGFSRNDWKPWNPGYVEKVMRSAPSIIVIDEASMIGACMSQVIFDTAEKYSKKLVLVGDWGQASPVNEEWPFKTPMFQNADVVRLTHAHRQNEREYLDALEEVRQGCPSADAVCTFNGRMGSKVSDAYIRMYATNRAVQNYNDLKVEELVRREQQPVCEPTTSVMSYKKDLTDAQKNQYAEDARFCHGDTLTPGCRVIMTWNGKGYVNGDLGTVEYLAYSNAKGDRVIVRHGENPEGLKEIHKDALQEIGVRLDRGTYLIGVQHAEAEFKGPASGNDNSIIAVAHGFPLRLGYAVTIHKSQGCTVDHALVDIGSVLSFPPTTRHGLAYVALSRTRTLAGLGMASLLGEGMVFCSDEVKKSGLL